jgi:glycosyltransferase involved in cell wall biosynthesis
VKILHTNFHRGWGGQSNRILVVSKGLAERGHEVVLAVPEQSELETRARAAGLEVFNRARFVRGFRPRSQRRDVKALRALIRGRGFDVIHTHGSQDSWAMAFTLWGFKPRPIVLRTKHNIFPIRDHWPNRRLYGRWTDGVVCISNSILEYCAAKPYLRRENLHLIHSAVDAERFAPDQDARSEIRSELGIQDRFVGGIVGRLREEKGHRYLFEALPEIVRAAPDFLLLVVGAGSLEDEFKAQVRQLGIEKSVLFTGFRPDVPKILSALDLFIMPSISEGLGTAALEAAAAARPIVAARVGGIPDILQDDQSGLLVPPRDPSALAKAVLRLHNDRDLASRYAQAAHDHVRANFSEEALVEKTERVYKEWLER